MSKNDLWNKNITKLKNVGGVTCILTMPPSEVFHHFKIIVFHTNNKF